MSKAGMSITVDNDLLEILGSHKNKSKIINSILRKSLATEEGIQAQITEHESIIAILKSRLETIRKDDAKALESLPAGLKEWIVGGYKEYDSDGEYVSGGIIKQLKEQPNKIYFYTKLINKKFMCSYRPEQIKKIINKLKQNGK